MGDGQPIGMLSGDFLFVGDLGRPDLLESAVGNSGAARQGAAALFESLGKLKGLPDYLQVWPGHGAGSACGKAMAAVPQSTLGFESRFNPLLQLGGDLEKFASQIMHGQTIPPHYFARMKGLNRDGAPILGELPKPAECSASGVKDRVGNIQFADLRPWKEYRAAHLPGSLHIPAGGSFLAVAASYLDPERSLILVCEPNQVDEIVRLLVRVGIDRVDGWIAPATIKEGGLPLASEIQEVSAADGLRMNASGEVTSLDVRTGEEFAEGAISGAINVPHVILPAHLGRIPGDRPVLVNCKSGFRSAMASAYLQSRGFTVLNLAGGYDAVRKLSGS
jgi:hydroxyacylglutathione hydrolase